LEDVTDLPLTDDITVTTSGNTNYKAAAITNTEENSSCGLYPIGGGFTYNGEYLFLAAASSNDGSIITLNLPEIPANSRVTLTYAKPVITNNGSTRRNEGDPYAYFKIADRYISINGGEFDTWLTASVVTGEATDEIVFYCDKWGAAAISKIEIEDASDAKLCSLTVNSLQYTNVKVNNVKFYADANGQLTLNSFADGEEINIVCEKDGYAASEKSVTVETDDLSVDMPLECELDASYYESDFGNESGSLALDGEFAFGEGYDAAAPVKVFGNITFTDEGALKITTDTDETVDIEYSSDGISIGGRAVTSKDNMEFEVIIDAPRQTARLSENGSAVYAEISGVFSKITGISGENVTVESIGLSYPDESKITIGGADDVSIIAGKNTVYHYDISADCPMEGAEYSVGVTGADGVSIDGNGDLIVASDAEDGAAVITAEYNGASASKTVEIHKNPTLENIKTNITSSVMNLYSSQKLELVSAVDEYGNEVFADFKDFLSSDESVIAVDSAGNITAVGAGTAVVQANAYTGADNPYSVEISVAVCYIDGICEDESTYVKNDFAADESVSSYLLSLSDGTSEEIAPTEIDAYSADKDGIAVTAVYDTDGRLTSVRREDVKAGDAILISNGSRKMYFSDGAEFKEITEPNSVTAGFEITADAGGMYEISPVYTFENVGEVKDEGKTFSVPFADGLYDITFKKGETWRGDIYVNGYMAGNNVDQCDADRTLTEGSLYTAEDVKIQTGSLNVSMTDGSTVLDYVTVTKKPEFYEREPRVYIIGDSLACIYYGEFEQEVGGGRAGWGQQIGDFLNVGVTDLANSGQYAAGLYYTAFPSVIENGCEGDILLIECAYNDRNYSTREEMTSCVKAMIAECRENGIEPILVTPNASKHDYKPSVAWSSYLKDIAVDTDCECIDLSKLSYDFLCSLYGDDEDNVVTMNFNLTAVGGDTLHSSYAGAYKWAATVAQELCDLGYEDLVNKDFSYTFTDTLGNVITAQVE
ncbi:MAG: hypothetical protein LUD03_01695, partial [Firmicutes bacterium]|nr:hypothetical protein [Bacillota bacterium]